VGGTHRTTAIFIAAIAAACLGSLFSSSEAHAGRPLDTGVADPEAYALGNPLAFAHTKKAGARFVRVGANWAAIAPAEEPVVWNPSNPADPNYHWDGIDREVSLAVSSGLVPLVQIFTAPRWAQRCQIPDSNALCDPDPQAVAEFAQAIASRYGGGFLGLPRVRYWELFNEPNSDFYFYPQFRDGKVVSPLLYRTLINAFSAAVKAVQRSNLVIGPGLTPLGYKRFSLAPLNFMRRLLCMRGRAHPRPGGCRDKTAFDIWSTNPYTTGGPTHHAADPDEVSLGDLPEMTRLLRAAERAARIRSALHPVPFWVTEFSWDSKPPDPGGLSWKILARWSAEAMYRAWHAGVSAFFWFGIRDRSNPSHVPPHLIENSGLYLRGRTVADDKPKRVFYAFRFPFVAFRGKSAIRVWGRTPNSAPGRVPVEVKVGRRWHRIATLHANRHGIFGKLVSTRYARKKRGLVRASYRGRHSLPFSLRYVGDFYAPPFGLAPGESHVPQSNDRSAVIRLPRENLRGPEQLLQHYDAG
jgi:hypothetical protein